MYLRLFDGIRETLFLVEKPCFFVEFGKKNTVYPHRVRGESSLDLRVRNEVCVQARGGGTSHDEADAGVRRLI